MPNDSMPVPHYPQSSPGACLPACARMVLAALGDIHTEATLAQAMDSYSFGTPASRVTRLQRLGYRVTYGTGTLADLGQYLTAGNFPIVFVAAEFLPWADFTGFHALVLTALTETDVWVMDPALDSGPTAMTIDAFLLTWEEFDCRLAVITK
jgi:ABC-type bacteriocin/lantibiotic exporter with double-glycine peptidase domain